MRGVMVYVAYLPTPAPTKQEPRVALFDATNTTKARRATLLARNRKETNATLLFVESICNDQVRLRWFVGWLGRSDWWGSDGVVEYCFHLCIQQQNTTTQTITGDPGPELRDEATEQRLQGHGPRGALLW